MKHLAERGIVEKYSVRHVPMHKHRRFEVKIGEKAVDNAEVVHKVVETHQQYRHASQKIGFPNALFRSE